MFRINVSGDTQGLKMTAYDPTGDRRLLSVEADAQAVIELAHAFDLSAPDEERAKWPEGIGPCERHALKELATLRGKIAEELPKRLQEGARLAALGKDLARVA